MKALLQLNWLLSLLKKFQKKQRKLNLTLYQD
ncbi:UNVERIFIED_CONTAM: hypothetical protein NCL1_18579 [Trichonephila clavipes]